jgi:hypothetical protein
MKPLARYDFPVNIRFHTHEVNKEVQPFYEGIIEVTLNFHIAIVFVPEIDRLASGWPPKLPDNIDNINSEMEARIITIATESYSVTPNRILAGKEEVVESSESGCQDGVLFYVTPDEFNDFINELNLLSVEIGRVYNSRKISEIQDNKFAQFILNRVIKSGYFRSFDLKILGRE